MLDPYVRAESASLTLHLSELPVLTGVAPIREYAISLDAETKAATKARLWQHHGCIGSALRTCQLPTIHNHRRVTFFAPASVVQKQSLYGMDPLRAAVPTGEQMAGFPSASKPRVSGVQRSSGTRGLGSAPARYGWRLGRGELTCAGPDCGWCYRGSLDDNLSGT